MENNLTPSHKAKPFIRPISKSLFIAPHTKVCSHLILEKKLKTIRIHKSWYINTIKHNMAEKLMNYNCSEQHEWISEA